MIAWGVVTSNHRLALRESLLQSGPLLRAGSPSCSGRSVVSFPEMGLLRGVAPFRFSICHQLWVGASVLSCPGKPLQPAWEAQSGSGDLGSCHHGLETRRINLKSTHGVCLLFRAVAAIGWWTSVGERESWKRAPCGSDTLRSVRRNTPETPSKIRNTTFLPLFLGWDSQILKDGCLSEIAGFLCFHRLFFIFNFFPC